MCRELRFSDLEAPRQISPDELRWKEPSSEADGRLFHIISNCIEEIERTGSSEEEIECKRVHVDGPVSTIMVSSTEGTCIDDAANLLHRSRSQLGKKGKDGGGRQIQHHVLFPTSKHKSIE